MFGADRRRGQRFDASEVASDDPRDDGDGADLTQRLRTIRTARRLARAGPRIDGGAYRDLDLLSPLRVADAIPVPRAK